MAGVSSGSRDCHEGEASMEAEAREMSCLATKATDMSHHASVAAQRSCSNAEAARRSRRAVDAADWSSCGMEAAENAAKMSPRTAAAWENVLWVGEDS